ncbi:MAG TPA: hypothetical protein VHT24_08765, partial [Pseudacidobacterium sp.]|nr:hypothetical protein [Pseudacidobacterium sp.]
RPLRLHVIQRTRRIEHSNLAVVNEIAFTCKFRNHRRTFNLDTSLAPGVVKVLIGSPFSIVLWLQRTLYGT